MLFRILWKHTKSSLYETCWARCWHHTFLAFELLWAWGSRRAPTNSTIGNRNGPLQPTKPQAIPESVGTESCFIVAGWDAGLVPCDHVLQRCLLNHIEADAHAGCPLHVVDVVRLQNGVHSKALDIQFHTHCRSAKQTNSWAGGHGGNSTLPWLSQCASHSSFKGSRTGRRAKMVSLSLHSCGKGKMFTSLLGSQIS